MTPQLHRDPQTILREGAALIGLHLHAAQVGRLLALGEQILAKNREINLTGARDLPTLVSDHILDSLALIPLIRRFTIYPPQSEITETVGVQEARDLHEFLDSPIQNPKSKIQNQKSEIAQEFHRPLLIDVGSGGGFPALPLAVVLEDNDFLCIESAAKKARALESLCAAIGLRHVTILSDRAEHVGHNPRWREKADWATARGIGCLATACELTLPFLRVGGVFLAQKGPDVQSELADAQFAITHLGGRVGDIVSVGPDRPHRRHIVVMIEKVSPTPAQFPRRPGLPAKRPLKDRG
jgi:16S rRNA (guanine527-N7)-methyltransferase